MNRTDIWNMTFPEWLTYMARNHARIISGASGNIVHKMYEYRISLFERINGLHQTVSPPKIDLTVYKVKVEFKSPIGDPKDIVYMTDAQYNLERLNKEMSPYAGMKIIDKKKMDRLALPEIGGW